MVVAKTVHVCLKIRDPGCTCGNHELSEEVSKL